MSQSTPINMIRRGGGGDQQPTSDMGMGGMPDIGNPMGSDSQLVEDILKEMGDSPGAEHQSSINSQALQYAMDSAQVPPNKYIPPQQHDSSMMDYNNYSQKMMMEQQQKQSGILGQLGFSLSGESLKEKIIKNVKYPGLVFVLCFLISLPEFNRFLFGFFPKLLLESGQVSIGGVMLKALVGMILFASIALFI
jgi:hypothetical protein